MTRPRFAFRADASAEIGTGHVRRCLTLAAGLIERGAECLLVMRNLGVDAEALARAAGVQPVMLPAPGGAFIPETGDPAHAAWARTGWRADVDETIAALAGDPPDVLIVDHYGFDARWHARARAGLRARLATIDDLGDRPLAVDLIIDPTLAEDHAAKHRLSAGCAPNILGGPDYAILGPAYRSRPPFPIRQTVASVGIFLGGSDIDNATVVAWQAARQALGAALPLEIVTTSANPHLPALRALDAQDESATLVIDAPGLAGFFARHDLQIGAGGGATWERCCIGAPTVLVAFADNQLAVARPLRDAGILVFSERGGRDVGALAGDVGSLAADQPRRAAMSARGRALVDGRGVERIVEALHDLLAH